MAISNYIKKSGFVNQGFTSAFFGSKESGQKACPHAEQARRPGKLPHRLVLWQIFYSTFFLWKNKVEKENHRAGWC
jgi:hypothetical protein